MKCIAFTVGGLESRQTGISISLMEANFVIHVFFVHLQKYPFLHISILFSHSCKIIGLKFDYKCGPKSLSTSIRSVLGDLEINNLSSFESLKHLLVGSIEERVGSTRNRSLGLKASWTQLFYLPWYPIFLLIPSNTPENRLIRVGNNPFHHYHKFTSMSFLRSGPLSLQSKCSDHRREKMITNSTECSIDEWWLI